MDLQGYREIRTRLSPNRRDVDINDIALATSPAPRGDGWRRAPVRPLVYDDAGRRPRHRLPWASLGAIGANGLRSSCRSGELAECAPPAGGSRDADAPWWTALSAPDRWPQRILGTHLHSLGARVGGRSGGDSFDLAITNVPGPQRELLCGRRCCRDLSRPAARARACARHRADQLSRPGLYGLFADRAAMPDLEVLADLIRDALAELMNSAAT